MLTPSERTNILKLVVVMLDAAAGSVYLADLAVAYEANGRSLLNLAKDLGNTSAYKALNPVFQTAAEFADSLLRPLGLHDSTVANDFVTAKFSAGVPKGEIAYQVAVALDATTDSGFAAAKALLVHKTMVAEYFSVDLHVAATNVGELKKALETVTSNPDSVASAERALDARYLPPVVPDPSKTNNGGTNTGSGDGTGSATAPKPDTSGPAAPDASKGQDTSPAPNPDADPGNTSDGKTSDDEHMGTMPSSESETMGTVIPESGGTVMVWDNDTQTFVPAAAHVGRSVSLAFAGNGDVVDHAAVALLGSAVLDHGGLHGMLLDHAGVHGLV